MTTAEAAQAWAEANDIVFDTKANLEAAEAAHRAAVAAERAAWSVLQDFAGRKDRPVVAQAGNGRIA